MPVYKEYPRGGSSSSRVEDAGERHLPIVVLVDTSGGMYGVKAQLAQGLTVLGDSLKEDPLTRNRVELCIIAFDNTAHIVTPFGPVRDYRAPELDFGGMSAMYAALDLALEEIEARKAQYHTNGATWYRPWICLLTDGHANDAENGVVERFRQAQEEERCLFMPVVIGEDADTEQLKAMNVNDWVLKADREDIESAFRFIGESQLRVIACSPCDDLVLSPGNYGLEIEF